MWIFLYTCTCTCTCTCGTLHIFSPSVVFDEVASTAFWEGIWIVCVCWTNVVGLLLSCVHLIYWFPWWCHASVLCVHEHYRNKCHKPFLVWFASRLLCSFLHSWAAVCMQVYMYVASSPGFAAVCAIITLWPLTQQTLGCSAWEILSREWRGR